MSGKALLVTTATAPSPADHVRRMSNGKLRTLIHHIHGAGCFEGTDGEVLGLAMCEVTKRFLTKGKKKR